MAYVAVQHEALRREMPRDGEDGAGQSIMETHAKFAYRASILLAVAFETTPISGSDSMISHNSRTYNTRQLT